MDSIGSTHALHQARALIRTIETLDAVEPGGWFERILVALLRTIYIQRLRWVSVMMPMWAVKWIAGVTEKAGREEAGRAMPTVVGGGGEGGAWCGITYGTIR
jgi:hypothetical protein